MNKTFDYEFGKIAVTLSDLRILSEDEGGFMCLVDITECMDQDDVSTMDQKELGKYIEFLQGVQNEMIEIDNKEEAGRMRPVENGTYEITQLLADAKEAK